jgi:hypothetical protein
MTVNAKTTKTTTTTTTTLRACMYIRVSTPSQEVEEQVMMIRQYAADHGIEIIHQYGDYQKRRKADQRRSFQAMLTDMETLKPDMILESEGSPRGQSPRGQRFRGDRVRGDRVRAESGGQCS